MRESELILRQTLLPLAAVLGAVGVLALLIYWIRAWWRESDGPAASDHELLADYRELNRRGELSDKEYRIIKSRLAERLGLPALPALPEEPTPPEA
jgi:hypothetical protein